MPRQSGHRAPGCDARRDGDSPDTIVGNDGRKSLAIDHQIHVKPVGTAGIPHQLFERECAALDVFGVLDDDRVTHQRGRNEKAQHLPEGQIPGHHTEDGPERLVDDLGLRAGDGLRLDVLGALLGEMPGA